jgi:ATP-dependent helicase/nuclease subunit B
MSAPEPERREWNARDFGNIAHLVLETWSRDPAAVDLSKREAIEEQLLEILARLLDERFGKRPPLAVRIQAEGLRQRLRWFARQQACQRASGWRIVEVERKFELTVGGVTVVGKIDRVDEHDDGRRRVLDYKTKAKADEVERAHRVKTGPGTRWPQHLLAATAVRCAGLERGKPVEKRWRNLQVPIYAAALGEVAELGYFALGATEAEVRLSLWEDFRTSDREAALRCAEWIVGQIKAAVFWPPAERVDYDDVEVLAAGKTLAATVAPWGDGGAA